MKVACYCAFCKNPRTVYRKKAPSLINYVQALGLATGLGYIFWRRLDPRDLVIAVVWLMIIEIFIVIRTRAEMPCPHCGFDPHLYLKNPALAAAKVKLHMDARKDDPNVWLARRPPIRLSRRGKKARSTREIVI